jgi:tetratricopeptide (TPR) repeat protein
MSSRRTVSLVAVLAVLPYLNALRADFTFDDVGVIRDNAAVRALPAVNLLGYVYQPGALYRPLTMLTYSANASVSAEPFGFHLVNVALHVLVSIAVLLLARQFLASPIAALAAAALFAVHPIHTEAVTGIVGRAELLAALGVLAALLASARSLRAAGANRRLWLTLSLAAFAAALLAKENAFTALGLLAVLHWWIEPRESLRRRLVVLLPYAAVAVGYLALRVAVVGSLALPEVPDLLDNPLAHVDTASRLRTATIVLWQYVDQLTVPLQLSADYSFNQIPVALSWGDARFLGAAVLCTTLALATLLAARRAPLLAIAALFVVIPLALTANVLFAIGTIKAERLLYLPSVGWCLAAGWLLGCTAVRHRRAAVGALVALLLVFGIRAALRNEQWRDDATLYTATLADAPASAKAHHNLAVALERAGRLDEAMAQFRRTLDIYPDYASAAFGIGCIYEAKGVDAGAVYWYERAVRTEPALARAHFRLGLLRVQTGEYDSAEAAFRTALASEPLSPMLLVNLSAVRLSQGDRWQAQTMLAQLDGIGTIDAEEHQLVAAARREIEVALQ